MSNLLFDSDQIKDEYRGDFARFIKRHANFFKHADTDANANAEIEFRLASNEMFITMSVEALKRMGEPLGHTEKAFRYWTLVHHPTWFPKTVANDKIPVDVFEHLRKVGRQEFFQAFLLVLRDRGEGWLD